MPDDFKYDVFLSHSAKDKTVVRPLAERLKASGLRIWFDEWVLKPGDSIPAKIEEGLEHSRVLVLCMSANAFGSDWAQLEAGTFRFRDPLNTDRRFIPLRLDNAPVKGSLPQFLYINWLPANREQEYAKLLQACRPLVGPKSEHRDGDIVVPAVTARGRVACKSACEMRMELSGIRNEVSAAFAKSRLKRIVLDCETLMAEDRGQLVDASILASSALNELAELECDAQARLQCRRKAIELCRQSLEKEHNSSLAISLANRVVDLFYDQFVREDRATMNSVLACSKAVLSRFSNKDTKADDFSLVLAQTASILRCQSMVSASPTAESLSREAVLCGERAVETCPRNQQGHLALGEALWRFARLARSDEDYFAVVNRAEKSLLMATQGIDPIAQFVLARFYRQTYRPRQAVAAFQEYENKEHNRRRLLSQSFVLGEAAMQIYYGGYTKETTDDVLQTAKLLLLEAKDAGYVNSRIYLALALINAAKGDLVCSQDILRDLSREPLASWTDVIARATEAISAENEAFLTSAFVLGVSDSWTWNSLGTYAAYFLHDAKFALSLYEIGRALNPKNAALLTNLSRVLLAVGDDRSLALANTHLDQAARYADRAFVWWRDVKHEWRKATGKPVHYQAHILDRSTEEKLKFKHLSDLFHMLEVKKLEPGTREKQFEGLVVGLLRLVFGSENVQGNHRIGVSSKSQVDAAFRWQGVLYRVEVTWNEHALGSDAIDVFRAILDTAEVRGLMVSMSGYTDGAIEVACALGKEHTLILLDGEEMERIFNGASRFELLIERKLDFFQRTGNPYGRNPKADMGPHPG